MAWIMTLAGRVMAWCLRLFAMTHRLAAPCDVLTHILPLPVGFDKMEPAEGLCTSTEVSQARQTGDQLESIWV